MSDSAKTPMFQLKTNRIEALGDGVFAIVMTLLILEIHVPHLADHGRSMPAGLLKLWPKFLCYIISFITLGVYWVAHHLHFYTIKRADRGLLWINVLFLMVVGLVPFSTALIGEHYDRKSAVIFFAANMILIGLALFLHWIYATHKQRLTEPGVDPSLVTAVKHVILMGPVVYLIAIGAAFIDTRISIALFLLVNLLYIIPGGAHLHLKHKPHASGAENG